MGRSFGENSLAPVGLRCRRERLPLSGYAASRMRKFGDFAAKGGGEVLGARSLALQSARGRLQKTLAARVGALGRRVLAGFSRVCAFGGRSSRPSPDCLSPFRSPMGGARPSRGARRARAGTSAVGSATKRVLGFASRKTRRVRRSGRARRPRTSYARWQRRELRPRSRDGPSRATRVGGSAVRVSARGRAAGRW